MLVIIGLVVGGVLVGNDLIRSAAERAQITQIEKYNQAVNTFRGKYQALPGDMDAATASRFGFTPRGQYAGEGDGNGIIEGVFSNLPGQNNGYAEGEGESATAWVDLTTANGLNLNLIDGSFSTASPNTASAYNVPATAVGNYFPSAKIGSSNYVYIYSQNGANYYGISAITSINGGSMVIISTPRISVRQAYDIDAKIDDGLAQSGNVIAQLINFIWGFAPSASPDTTATCFNSVTKMYSILVDNGTHTNCALSFKFQ